MKMVKIEILPARDGEVVTATVYLQTHKGGGKGNWKDGDEKYVVKSGTTEASRTVLLDDDERLIVEGAATTKVVIDKEQGSAHEVPIEEAVEEAEPSKEADEKSESFPPYTGQRASSAERQDVGGARDSKDVKEEYAPKRGHGADQENQATKRK